MNSPAASTPEPPTREGARLLEARTAAPAATPSGPAEAVRQLEEALRARRRGGLRRTGLWLALGVVLLAGVGVYRRATRPAPPARYATEAASVRDIVETVESSGKLKPLTEVAVGAQVSGGVVAVHVDFNSRVKKGQLLAEIDPSLMGSQVTQAEGQLGAAKAALVRAQAAQRTARLQLERADQLQQARITSQADLDQAQNALDVASADVASANAQIRRVVAQLESANASLAYTKIYSPIDGVVINRAVDPGQTVAANFSAPVLFEIAQDLSAMQVLADIDEADVGKIVEGMEAEVSVDAFLGEGFDGTVTQLRYSPNEVAGVVTYGALIDVPNPALKLRPGMTATVRITTRKAEQVTALPNAALRFKPEPEDKAKTPATPAKLGFNQGRVYRLPQAAASEQGAAEASSGLEAVSVRLGITDGVWTALAGGGVASGDALVTRERKAPTRRKLLGIF